MSLTTDDLTPREGKVLRHVATTNDKPTNAARITVRISWSDLPHTLLQARATLERLRKLKLVERRSDGYWPTPAGTALIKYADKNRIWYS